MKTVLNSIEFPITIPVYCLMDNCQKKILLLSKQPVLFDAASVIDCPSVYGYHCGAAVTLSPPTSEISCDMTCTMLKAT